MRSATVGERSAPLTLTEALQLIEHLRRAVDSHELCGQATGVLVAVHRIGPETAWAVLQHASQHHNIKLARIAAAVIQLAAGTVDGHDPEAAVLARQLIAGSVDASTPLVGEDDHTNPQ